MGIFMLEESNPVPGPQGPQGNPGIQGPQGLTGLKGDTGDQGIQGIPGVPGAVGAIGEIGLTGATGQDGISAYQVALTNGFVGTESQWLASLVGPQGVVGATGSVGATGAQGIGLNPVIPTSMSVTLGTAYQPSTTKPTFISVMIDVAYSLTVAGSLADIVELWVGPTSAVATGASGLRVASFRSSLTGIALSIGMGQGDRQQLSAIIPVGYYFAVRRTTGTTATIAESFIQTLF